MRLQGEVLDRLDGSSVRARLLDHPFFRHCESAPLTRDTVQAFLGQYWSPIHYFPDFLSRSIAATDVLEARTAISKILYQELGEGQPRLAHEKLYLFTMDRAGFDVSAIRDTRPNAATERLMEGYRRATSDGWSAMGYLFGTEAADLTLVKALGRAVERTGAVNGPLPWVEIHVVQEPDHTAMAAEAVELTPTDVEAERLVAAATEAWERWSDFFSSLDALVATPAPEPHPA